jgi:transposase InsO family protein
MSYSKNPNLPKVRADAVKMVRSGKSTREVSRYFGYSQSAIVKWCAKVPKNTYQYRVIPTESSRPFSHPDQLSEEIIKQIVDYRYRTRRGAEYIHFMLKKDDVSVSLSSVKRTLKRHGLTRYSKWKKWHHYNVRPLPSAPGLLVEADTIHDGPVGHQMYIYTLLDVYSRWAYAKPTNRIGAELSSRFLSQAQNIASFQFSTIQTDHGSEFSKWFTKKLSEQDISHRHSRVRTPNDNAHLERFNRTIQEECICRLPRKLSIWQREIPEYLNHYNNERPHMGINWQTPAELLQK